MEQESMYMKLLLTAIEMVQKDKRENKVQKLQKEKSDIERKLVMISPNKERKRIEKVEIEERVKIIEDALKNLPDEEAKTKVDEEADWIKTKNKMEKELEINRTLLAEFENKSEGIKYLIDHTKRHIKDLEERYSRFYTTFSFKYTYNNIKLCEVGCTDYNNRCWCSFTEEKLQEKLSSYQEKILEYDLEINKFTQEQEQLEERLITIDNEIKALMMET